MDYLQLKHVFVSLHFCFFLAVDVLQHLSPPIGHYIYCLQQMLLCPSLPLPCMTESEHRMITLKYSQLLSSSFKFCTPIPTLQYYYQYWKITVSKKKTYFGLSKKHVCNENSIICSPSVLLSSHFTDTILERKIKTRSDKKN